MFATALALTFLLLTLAPAITGGLWGRFGDQVINSALTEPLWRMRLGLNVALFALAVIALHLCLAGFCWLMAVASQAAWPRATASRWQWILLWFVLCCFWLMMSNAAGFPNTMLGFPYHALAVKPILSVPLFVLVTIGLAAVALATLLTAAVRARGFRRPLLALCTVTVTILMAATLPREKAGQLPTESPNVVLIGIDSLRIDGVNAEHTPNLHKFLSRAAVAPDAITPLARTFPSWASILTGKNPHTTGAIMNLLPRDRIRTGMTLPSALREKGYRTAYGIDEVRFSNIDQSYGFDQTITPNIGASDFVIGTFADLPLLNLIVNTRLGGWLFPNLHANRAASNLYEPSTYIRRLARELRYDKPLFLAVHLTLPHWPYTWASSSLEPLDGPTQRGHYLDTLRRVDAQFGELLGVLDRQGALHNALVIVLSDHGQAFQADDALGRAVDRELHGFGTFDVEGHGTSVLVPMQYRVVLGFRGYGPMHLRLPGPAIIQAPASLIDIAPTVLDLVGLSGGQDFEGVSLAPFLMPGDSRRPDLSDRIRFTETEYSPFNFSEGNMTGSVMANAARAYQIDATTDRVSVRMEWLERIMSNRQYAAIIGDRALAAAIPGRRRDGRRQLVYVGRPFAPDAESGAVSLTDREKLKGALQARFSLDMADPASPQGMERLEEPPPHTGRKTTRNAPSGEDDTAFHR